MRRGRELRDRKAAIATGILSRIQARALHEELELDQVNPTTQIASSAHSPRGHAASRERGSDVIMGMRFNVIDKPSCYV